MIRRREITREDLPSTVEILEDDLNHGRIYLVGTAHFSESSQNDVIKTINLTQPDLVMLELCRTRINILSLDERTILEQASNLNLNKVLGIIRQNGLIAGLINVLLLSLSAHLTRQLGMAPGKEFRVAFQQAQTINGCQIVLGDRPIEITLKRAIQSLSKWNKIRLIYSLLTSQDRITLEDVEKFKEKDLLEKFISEMSEQFPELARVFIEERDIYLSYSLRKCLQSIPVETTNEGFVGSVVVAVVGIGHLQGIIRQWKTNVSHSVEDILTISTCQDENKIRKTNKIQRWFNSRTLKCLSLTSLTLLVFYLNRSRFAFIRR